MLYEMIKGNYVPIISIFIAGWGSALLYEGLNAPTGLWRYSNIPLSEFNVFGIPILIFLIWPFQYFPLFSLYRLLFKKETEQVWK
jgi:hypothetical protein